MSLFRKDARWLSIKDSREVCLGDAGLNVHAKSRCLCLWEETLPMIRFPWNHLSLLSPALFTTGKKTLSERWKQKKLTNRLFSNTLPLPDLEANSENAFSSALYHKAGIYLPWRNVLDALSGEWKLDNFGAKHLLSVPIKPDFFFIHLIHVPVFQFFFLIRHRKEGIILLDQWTQMFASKISLILIRFFKYSNKTFKCEVI